MTIDVLEILHLFLIAATPFHPTPADGADVPLFLRLVAARVPATIRIEAAHRPHAQRQDGFPAIRLVGESQPPQLLPLGISDRRDDAQLSALRNTFKVGNDVADMRFLDQHDRLLSAFNPFVLGLPIRFHLDPHAVSS